MAKKKRKKKEEPKKISKEEGDELLSRMQKPGVRCAMQDAFSAPSEELGKAALGAARKKRK